MTPWLVALTLLGCRKVDPAPEDLDGLVHFAWAQLDEGDDEALVDAMVNLHAAVDGDDLDDVVEGEVSSLAPEQVELLRPDVDPGDATGVFIADVVRCTLPQLESLLAYPAQDELYTGVYESYDRTYTSDADAYLEGESDRMGWDLEYRSAVLGAGFTAHSRTLVRRVAEVETPEGPAMVLRAHLLEPAVFDNEGSNNHLTQDWHLELYWPRGADELVHVYALWKDTRLFGFEDEGETAQRLILNNLADWDEGTSQLCQEGLPEQR